VCFALLAIAGVADAAIGGPISTQLTFIFFAVVTQIIPVIAITLFPFKRPEEWRLKAGFVRAKLFGRIPVITVSVV